MLLPLLVTANYHHEHHPYGFGYDVHDGHGNHQYRHEKGLGHHEVKGSYGYKDAHGIHRHVDYVADKHGFRAHIKTNEPGTAPKDPAAVHMDAHPVPNPPSHKYHEHGGSYSHKHVEHHHGPPPPPPHHGYESASNRVQQFVKRPAAMDASFLPASVGQYYDLM